MRCKLVTLPTCPAVPWAAPVVGIRGEVPVLPALYMPASAYSWSRRFCTSPTVHSTNSLMILDAAIVRAWPSTCSGSLQQRGCAQQGGALCARRRYTHADRGCARCCLQLLASACRRVPGCALHGTGCGECGGSECSRAIPATDCEVLAGAHGCTSA